MNDDMNILCSVLLSLLHPCCTMTSCVQCLLFPSHYKVGPAAQLLRFTPKVSAHRPTLAWSAYKPLSCGQGAPSIILTLPRASCSGEEQVSPTAS